jgi:hypothetical protein
MNDTKSDGPTEPISEATGVKSNAVQVWRQRAITYRYQLKLLHHFGQTFTITDWSPDTTVSVEKPSIAATWFKKQRERQFASQNDGRPRALLSFAARLWRAGCAIVTNGRLSF